MTISIRLLLAGLLATTLCPPAFAQEQAAPFSIAAPDGVTVQPAGFSSPATLRQFGVAGQALMLTGERADLDLPFYVTASETAQTARLTIAFTSAVSVMPETSHLQVIVNDIPVGSEAIIGGTPGRLSVEMPSGMLQPGYNSVRLIADQHHRVDCSLAGTYELWTRIDPDASGFDFGLQSNGTLADLSEMPALFRSSSGKATINFILPANAGLDLKENALQLAQAISRLARVGNVATSFSSAPMMGDGLDVAIAPSSPSTRTPAILDGTPIDGVSFIPAAGSSRSRLVIDAGVTGDLTNTVEGFVSAIEKFEPRGTKSGLAARRGRLSIAKGQSVPLGEMGLDTREFAGRLYRSSIAFNLPADFYAADYASAHITLDAAFAGGLDPDAGLIGYANDKEVFTLPLSSPVAGRIRRQDLKIPLSALRPGANEIAIAAVVSKPIDAVCDPTTIGNLEPRVLLSSSSTLAIPDLALVGHVPELASFTSGGTDDGEISLFAPGSDLIALAKASDLLAKIAATTGHIRPVKLLATPPSTMTGNLLAVGTFASLPGSLLGRVGLASPTTDRGTLSGAGLTAADPSISQASTGTGASGSVVAGSIYTLNDHARYASFTDAFSRSPELAARVAELSGQFVQAIPVQLRSLWSAVSGAPNADAFIAPRDSKLVFAQAATEDAEPATWTVVAATDQHHLTDAVDAVVDTNAWNDLGGAISVVGDKGEVSRQPAAAERLFETQERSFSNIRLIVAGWLSRHLEVYMVALLGIALLLSLATFLFLGQVGTARR